MLLRKPVYRVTSVSMLTQFTTKTAKRGTVRVRVRERERERKKLLVKPALTYVKGRGKAASLAERRRCKVKT